MKIFNKKAEEEFILSWWDFIIIAFIVVFILVGVVIFGSSLFDVRSKSSGIIDAKVADCLFDNGYLKFDVQSLDKSQIIDKCSLNAGILEANQYYIGISFKDFNTNNEIRKSIELGDPSFSVYCKLNNEDYPKCQEKRIYVFGQEKNTGSVKISEVKEKDILVNKQGQYIVSSVSNDAKVVKVFSNSVLVAEASPETLLNALGFTKYIENKEMIISILAASNNRGGST